MNGCVILLQISVKVKVGDVIEIQFGTKTVKVEVLDLQDTTKKEEAKDLFFGYLRPVYDFSVSFYLPCNHNLS